MKKKVLLTGASGFIGRQTIPYLLSLDYEIHAVYYPTLINVDQTENLFWHQINLLNTEETKQLISDLKPTHLLHFAWDVTPGKYWTSLANIHWVQASLNLVLNFIEYGGQRVVIAGTCAEYDWSYGYCTEKLTPLNPGTLYGICKNSLFHITDSLAKLKEVNFAWGRIFFLYGPYEHPDRLIASVIRSLLNNQPARCTHGEQVRDFLYVKDVAAAFVALLDGNVCGPVNIASGSPVTLKSVILQIAQFLKSEHLIQLGAIPSSPTEPPLLVAGVDRLTKEVGWLPKYSIDHGIEETVNWWKINC